MSKQKISRCTSIKEVERFLQRAAELIENLQFVVLLLDSRDKNLSTLHALGMTNTAAGNEIRSLTVENYSSGPEPDDNPKYKGDVWFFGKVIDRKEIYIKLKINTAGDLLIVISFHEADHAICYPYKKK